jgi:hypothetical protein
MVLHGIHRDHCESLFLKLFLLGPQAFVTAFSAARGLQRVPRVALPADLNVKGPGLCLWESRQDKYLWYFKTFLLKVLEAYNGFAPGINIIIKG